MYGIPFPHVPPTINIGDSTSSLEMKQMYRTETKGRMAWLVVALTLFAGNMTLAQSKSERERKPAEPPTPAQNAAAPGKNEDPLFKGMKYRAIGPFRGGRSLTAAGLPGDPTTYYFGSTGGGIWKSTDGATTWKPVFDKEASSVGSIAVSASDPNVIYAGTGEACIRGNAAQGDGVYKSLDGGKTWRNTGLRDSRAPWNLSSGGPGSGLYRSEDGGTTWKRVEHEGLPKGPYGKIGVAVAANSDRVWALIEAKDGGLYRSDDGGEKWELINGDHRF